MFSKQANQNLNPQKSIEVIMKCHLRPKSAKTKTSPFLVLVLTSTHQKCAYIFKTIKMWKQNQYQYIAVDGGINIVLPSYTLLQDPGGT